MWWEASAVQLTSPAGKVKAERTPAKSPPSSHKVRVRLAKQRCRKLLISPQRTLLVEEECRGTEEEEEEEGIERAKGDLFCGRADKMSEGDVAGTRWKNRKFFYGYQLNKGAQPNPENQDPTRGELAFCIH